MISFFSKDYSPTAKQITDLAIKIHSQFIKAREKSKLAFKETLERNLTNIVMFLDVMRPRNFDSADLLTELPGEITF